jgi:hypothetical protein
MAVNVTFRASREDDGTVQLCVAFASEKFAGAGSAYFQSTELYNFAKALDVYPLDKQKAPLLSGGYWDALAKRVAEEHVGVSVVPRGTLGKILLTIRVALPADEQDVGNPKSSAMIQIEAEPAQLSILSLHLQMLADGTEQEFAMTFA